MALALVVGLGALSAAAGRADEKPAPKAEVGKLTNDQLREMLDDLGYEPQTIELKNGGKRYRVKLNRDGWNFSFDAELSTDRTVVWLSARLSRLPAAGQVRAEPLEKLLAMNTDLCPMHFLVKSDRQLALDLPLEVIDLTPAELRTRIDGLLSTVKRTYPTWDEAGKPVGTAAAPAPAKK
jgi:hypothetical protein